MSNGRLFYVDYSNEQRGSVEFGEFLDLVKHCDVLNMAALHVVARLTLYSLVVTMCTAIGHYIPPVVTICTASGHYMYRQFNIQQLHVLPTQCIYVFCVDLRTNSDYFRIQH